MDFFLDRHSDLPIRRQIRGMIEYAISFGDFGIGTVLPSVRDLAGDLGVAPMTVSQVYADLKRDGLVEARPGAGTFVADSARAQLAARRDIGELHRAIDALIDGARERGIGFDDFGMLVSARLAYRKTVGRRTGIVVAGLFEEATQSYATAIAAQVGPGATVRPVTIDRIEADAALRARLGAADLVVTFLALRQRLAELVPNGTVVAIRFIPSEATRLALAGLDPMARVAAVSRFSSFLPILQAGVRRFAPHCRDIAFAGLDDPDLAARLADRTALIFSTGAEAALARAPAQLTAIEYRHIPDPGDIDRLVRPLLATAPQGKDMP